MRRIAICAVFLTAAACATGPTEPVQTGCHAVTFPVYFARDQITLDELNLSVLDTAAERLGGCAGARLEVAGYSDPAGDPDLNRRISSDRAHAVFEALLERGVAAEQVEIQAVGEAGARTESGQTEPMRRRVEVHFVPAGA